MKTLCIDFAKIIFDKIVWIVASLLLLTITFGASLNSRVNALESKEAVKDIKMDNIDTNVKKVDKKLSKALCIWGVKIECE